MALPPDLTGPGFRLHHPYRGWLVALRPTEWRNGVTWREARVLPTRAAAERLAPIVGGDAGSLVAVVDPGRDARRWLVSHWPACARGLRTGRCRLDEGHRGRCSTAAFYCDSCGKMRRGRPAETLGGGEVDLCWFCCHVQHGTPGRGWRWRDDE